LEDISECILGREKKGHLVKRIDCFNNLIIEIGGGFLGF